MRRALSVGLLLVAVLIVSLLAGVGWYYSNSILGPDAPRVPRGHAILGRTDSTITLATNPKALRPGPWALEWEGGFGAVGPILAADSSRVVRRFRIAGGTPPGETGRLAGFAVDADPQTWLGVAFVPLTFEARIGPLAAWLVPGSDSTWAIFVHGRAASRAELLRTLPAYLDLGLPCLLITYRNDRGAPQVDGGSYRLGYTEWHDVDDAVRFATEHGARDVVLVGCSMGGGIVAEFLRKSTLRHYARAAVLDAPALDWDAAVALSARQRHVPQWSATLGKFVTWLRTGIRWDDLVQVRHAAEFQTPILIVHGERDETVPIDVSRRFAAARPDLVTLVPFPDAGHVESSNFDGARYVRVVSDWLRARGVGSAPAPAP
jgi:uncharacterized protein